jgi:ribonucleoside-diphosphate reductase alpha chain/ribonucleoside-triphosphate reductase
LIEYRLLDDDFFEPYRLERQPAHMNELGAFVFYRTYSRWLPDEQRRETWAETVRRAVEYNCQLVPGVSREEAQKLFDNVYNLRQFLSGRTMWVGGTPVAYKFPMSNYNCSFIVLDSLEAFAELFYLLMIGTGVGFRVLPRDVAQLPRFRTDVTMAVAEYRPVPKHLRRDDSELVFRDGQAHIIVGDSKEGWIQALAFYLECLTASWAAKSVESITLDFSHVRPKGERLVTFGGTASGHEPLREMFEKIHAVITASDGTLKPIDVLDIANLIGGAVVVGGVRRTAEIGLGGADDEAFWNAKKTIVESGKFHRFLSNNSVFYESKPDAETLHRQFETLRDEGEPCFVNAQAARKRRPRFEGVNPCVEILLDNRGLCNLTTVNVAAFVDENGKVDLEALFEAQRLSARASYRMTCVTLELPSWDAVQKRDRLLGCSLTGWFDAMDRCGFGKTSQRVLLSSLRRNARDAADAYADELGAPRSLLVTAVKPEGTLSQVAGGVSPGVHRKHSPYFVRRIRISAEDPLVKVAMSLGWPTFPEVGSTWENARTLVIEFPVKAGEGTTKYDVSAIEQLETYRMFQTHYCEHNASNTITVRDDEWSAVERWVGEKWNDVVAVSFLKLDGHVYELAPYEAITAEEYDRRRASMKPFDPELLRRFERGEDFDIGDDGCDNGICPVR